MYGDGKRLERDPVDADGNPIPQWGGDVAKGMTSAQLVAARDRGHFNNYLLGEEVVSEDAPARPEQATAEQVAGMSRAELVEAAAQGRLADYLATPNKREEP